MVKSALQSPLRTASSFAHACGWQLLIPGGQRSVRIEYLDRHKRESGHSPENRTRAILVHWPVSGTVRDELNREI
jgi:hypothetical protein